jgi:chromosome segregation ATPase
MSAELYKQISAIIDAPDRDLKRIERTLTDGYARALSLEAEKWRIQKRITEVTQELEHGDAEVKARELSTLAQRLDGNAGELSELRGRLGALRRHAETVRR